MCYYKLKSLVNVYSLLILHHPCCYSMSSFVIVSLPHVLLGPVYSSGDQYFGNNSCTIYLCVIGLVSIFIACSEVLFVFILQCQGTLGGCGPPSCSWWCLLVGSVRIVEWCILLLSCCCEFLFSWSGRGLKWSRQGSFEFGSSRRGHGSGFWFVLNREWRSWMRQCLEVYRQGLRELRRQRRPLWNLRGLKALGIRRWQRCIAFDWNPRIDLVQLSIEFRCNGWRPQLWELQFPRIFLFFEGSSCLGVWCSRAE